MAQANFFGTGQFFSARTKDDFQDRLFNTEQNSLQSSLLTNDIKTKIEPKTIVYQDRERD